MHPTPPDPAFRARVRESFARQGLMRTLGATLERVSPGEVEIALPRSDAVTQQHGFVHAAAVTAVLDSACGYAALTLMAAGSEVLSVEFKVNLLAPAAAPRLVARARVVRAGRTLTVCAADAFGVDDGGEKQVAMMSATLFRVEANVEGNV